jgi:hypothetical protein
MADRRLTVTTSFDFHKSKEHIWQGITNAVMTQPKPLCFNLGVPLPVKCEITRYENGTAANRRCTSDKGAIEQTITCFEKGRRLAFKMVSHNLRSWFSIGEMNDDFVFHEKDNGVVTLTRTTNLSVPSGWLLGLRAWAIRKSIANVHRYVYRNIAATP